MRLPCAFGVGLRLFDIDGKHRYLNAADGDGWQIAGHADAGGDGVGDYLCHATVALEFGGLRSVDCRCGDSRNQVTDCTGDDTGLAQRGKHLIDVMQERGAGAHHQYAGTFQCASMRVEQVSGTVQGHSGFAGAWAALYHHGTVHVRADNAVLLGLDGGHDVGHFARATRAERSEQCTFAGQGAGSGGLAHLVRMHVQYFVFDAYHFAETQRDMAAHHDVAMVGGRRLIEGAGRFGSPIGQNGFMVGARQTDATDVMTSAVLRVKSSEHEPVFHAAQLSEAIFVHGGKRIALGALGGGAVRTGCSYGAQSLPHFGAQVIQTSIGAIDGLLLLVQL